MSREIKPKFQPAIADKKRFLAPLQSPAIQAIIHASGIDDNATKYTVMKVLQLFLFAGILKGFFQPLRGIVSLRGNFMACWFAGLVNWTLRGRAKIT